jgi:hypothetical protein
MTLDDIPEPIDGHNPQAGLDWLVTRRDLLDDADFTAAGTNGYTVDVQVGTLDALVGMLAGLGILEVPEPYLHGRLPVRMLGGDQVTLLTRLFHRHHVCHRFPAFDRPGWYEQCECGAGRYPGANVRAWRKWSRRNR